MVLTINYLILLKKKIDNITTIMKNEIMPRVDFIFPSTFRCFTVIFVISCDYLNFTNYTWIFLFLQFYLNRRIINKKSMARTL
jgi:hypothetical protein